jgi:eukaryotic-like serine/threonine-protein kinase
VAIGSFSTGLRDIWIYDLVRGGSYRLTHDPTNDNTNPVWSADGRTIIFVSSRGASNDIYRRLASGTGDDELVYADGTRKYTDSASIDGTLWLHINGLKGRDIYQFSFEDRKLTKYISTGFVEDDAQISPDGHWLAYRSNQNGKYEVYVQPFPATERPQVSTAGGVEPQWSRDGRELFFLVGKTLSAVDITSAGKSVTMGKPHALFDVSINSYDMRNHYAVTPDGKKFLVITQQEQQGKSFDAIVNWPELLKGK